MHTEVVRNRQKLNIYKLFNWSSSGLKHKKNLNSAIIHYFYLYIKAYECTRRVLNTILT